MVMRIITSVYTATQMHSLGQNHKKSSLYMYKYLQNKLPFGESNPFV